MESRHITSMAESGKSGAAYRHRQGRRHYAAFGSATRALLATSKCQA